MGLLRTGQFQMICHEAQVVFRGNNFKLHTKSVSEPTRGSSMLSSLRHFEQTNQSRNFSVQVFIISGWISYHPVAFQTFNILTARKASDALKVFSSTKCTPSVLNVLKVTWFIMSLENYIHLPTICVGCIAIF